MAPTKMTRVVAVIFYDMDAHAAGSPLPREGGGAGEGVPRRADELVACSLSELRANYALHDQRREDCAVCGRAGRWRCRSGGERRGKPSVLPRVFPLLERTALLRST